MTVWQPVMHIFVALAATSFILQAIQGQAYAQINRPRANGALNTERSIHQPRHFDLVRAASAKHIGHLSGTGGVVSGSESRAPVHQRLVSITTVDGDSIREIRSKTPRQRAKPTPSSKKTRPKTLSKPVATQTELVRVAKNVEQVPAAEAVEPIPRVTSALASPTCEGSCGWQGDCFDCGPCYSCFLPAIQLNNLYASVGVHGFKNPTSFGLDGSFGFHEGVNWAAPLKLFPCSEMGVQAGVNVVHSNFSNASFTDDNRNQVFFTTGVFRRADWGLQAGVVFDHLHDNWHAEIDLSQVRGEISWVYPFCHEWGFWFTASSEEDTAASPIVAGTTDTWSPTDLYAFFYRRRFDGTGGDGRVMAGFSENGDGLVGVEMYTPINDRWAMESTATYLVPNEPTGDGGTENEGWNLSVNLVWSYGCTSACPDYYRPLLRVADNGTFFLDRLR